jgi:hypothetical protein
MKVDFKFSNGEEVKDVVSGFTGIIDCVSLWLNGCRRYSVQPKMKEGETTKPDSLWIDEESIVKLSDGVKKTVKPTKTGGPSFSSSNARM